MVRISVLHDALKTMNNAERKGKRQALVRPSSKVVIKFLQVMMKHGASGVRLAVASARQHSLLSGMSCNQSHASSLACCVLPACAPRLLS